MIVKFNGNEYKKNGRNGAALKNLCFDIFKYYLELNKGLSYEKLQEPFNKWHCNNNFVVLSKSDWENKTEDSKKRYFEPIFYNNIELYFTTQWGNNGGDCDNINNMISFAKEQNYDIKVVVNEDSILNIESSNPKVKNIMLYGAPGVGKTHNYKRLITMIENGEDEKTIFDTISKNKTTEQFDDATFETIKKDKRIEFVTFHQSYSYEDFIEGFRPNENGNIELDKKGGIFKRIADKARNNLEESRKETLELKQEITFQQQLNNFIEKLENEIEINGYYQITDAAYISSIDSDAFRYNIRKENPTYRYDLRMKFEDLVEFEKNNVSSRQDVKKLENINSLANQHATYYFKIFNEIISNTKNPKISEQEIEKIEQKNYYIVIDEINRGNISKIFGELITLIEEDKRDSYEITLPYSKEKFKIPSNLYIIATMNSTDKSIATIDIALRRRFTFLKMKPKSSLVQNHEAKILMENLNKFIGDKNILGEDYMLGHSYFMGDNIDLEFVKKYKIQPLLEEYFYGDDMNYNKAIEILNKVDKQ
jgi:5-methylcytosine-specific restriction protein B